MQLINFDSFIQNNRAYGGLSGQKIGIVYNGNNYLLKFPGSTKDSKGIKFKNINLSYSNSPICEYLGSHIYEILNIPVHKTILGFRSGKTVVACKDFVSNSNSLLEFNKIMTTFEYDTESNSNGQNSDLKDILNVLDNHPFFKQVQGIKERFWDMFIVDAFIGNGDRNNGNWGLLRDSNDNFSIAPVYDNGGCLNNKWDDMKMKNCLSDKTALISQAYNGITCNFEKNGKRINPYHYLQKTKNKDCIKEIKFIVPKIHKSKNKILKLFKDNPLLSDIAKEFYISILSIRYQKALLPIFNNVSSLSK